MEEPLLKQPDRYISIPVEEEKMQSPSQISKPNYSSSSSLGGNDAKGSNTKEVNSCCVKVCENIILIIGVIAFLAYVLVIKPIKAIPLFLLKLAFYIMAHIVQVFRTNDDNEVRKFMGAVAGWLSIRFGFISVGLLLCMWVFGVVPSLKHRALEGVSITRWIGVLAIICVFFTFSTGVRYFLGYRRLKREASEKRSHFYEGIIGSINSLLYLFALFSVTRVAPIFKAHKILSLSTLKWIRMILLVIFGHHAICIVTSAIVLSLRGKYIESGNESGQEQSNCVLAMMGNLVDSEGFHGTFTNCMKRQPTTNPTEQWTNYIVVYYAEGLRKSFNFVLTSLLVLLTWILYFGSCLNRSLSEIGQVYDFVFWTCFCMLVTAFLWLVKSGVVLSWEARVVCNPFKKMISDAANQLYLIAIIAGPEFDVLGFWENRDEAQGEGQQKQKAPDADQGRQPVSQLDEQGYQTSSESNREEGSSKEEIKELGATRDYQAGSEIQQPANQGTSHEDRDHDDYKKDEIAQSRAREILVRKESKDSPYTSDISRMARYFMAAEGPLSRDGYVADFVAKWGKENPQLPNYCNKSQPDGTNSAKHVPVRNLLGSKLEQVDVDLFLQQLNKDKYKITDPEQWLKKYLRVCLDLGRKIAGAMEVVDCLNNIMIVVLVAAMIIVWLLLTKIATTKVFVLIASPVFGASFIFGESASTLFKGIMFTYVMHPFNVGERCTIENVKVEVKRIGVWKTIFSKVGTTDEVVYPNTVLATTSIVNHKGEADPNDYVDYVELRLNSTTKKEQILQLKRKILEHLDHNEDGFRKHPPGVLVKDIGETVTIAVHFKHDVAKIGAMTSTDRIQKKSESRQEFLLQIKAFLDEIDNKEGTNTHTSSSPITKGKKQMGIEDRQKTV